MSSNLQILPLSVCYWQKIDFFKGLPSELLKDILFGSEIVNTNSKNNIFYEGDRAEHFGFVVEGVFKIYRMDPLGQRVAMDFVTSGGMVAGMLMADEESLYPVTIQSVNSGKFLKIPKSTYYNFWSHHAEIMKKVQLANMERVKSLQTMRESQRLPLEKRVAWALIKLLSESGKNDKFLKVYFSRADIADAVGAAPESVIRVFSKWTKEGLIKLENDEEFIDLQKINQNYFL